MSAGKLNSNNENFSRTMIVQHPISGHWQVALEQDGFMSHQEAMLFAYVSQHIDLWQTMAELLERKGANLQTGEGVEDAIPQIFLDAFEN